MERSRSLRLIQNTLASIIKQVPGNEYINSQVESMLRGFKFKHHVWLFMRWTKITFHAFKYGFKPQHVVRRYFRWFHSCIDAARRSARKEPTRETSIAKKVGMISSIIFFRDWTNRIICSTSCLPYIPLTKHIKSYGNCASHINKFFDNVSVDGKETDSMLVFEEELYFFHLTLNIRYIRNQD